MTTQQWDPISYERQARFVSNLGAGVVELLAPQPGERILDLGCGDGALTETLVAAGCQVVAIDGSPEQVAGARARGLDARVHDAASLPFVTEFDAVFSNAVLHWIRDADGVLDSVFRALKPGGRFVAEFGGAGCVETVRLAVYDALARRRVDGAAADPWFFPTAERYQQMLERHGFTVEMITLFARPTPLPGDIADWLETFAHPLLGTIPKAERRALAEEVRDAVAPKLYDAERGWWADYTRLRFAAVRPQMADG
ncbi:MAG TPA: methyltransferase domain-containing protein [Vicinamibacterales bacterium]|jgi:SAM-dependent methyltransferase